ncbi:hypothetical protein ACTQXG_19265 [Parabacteroides distasonis]|uniref:Uncharacterized protein n=1 Tax=Parabacteroides distasonis TaxID=823 RepID=A0AAW6FBJ1_PARDI|nr:hypothetical protein [Parabacteroides distasonis]MDB9140523.1 hypothetical protein [Parabacteroides distasonis]MDB9142870.1 hypothetical protein [Parabacteroides distasonis]
MMALSPVGPKKGSDFLLSISLLKYARWNICYCLPIQMPKEENSYIGHHP